MNIRRATAAEAPTIAGFQEAMAWETEKLRLDSQTVQRGVEAVFADTRKGEYWLAEEDGQVVASLLTIPEWSDWRCGTVLWIHSLYVVPTMRRRGVFARMFRHLQQLVESSPDLKGLRLYVDHSNHAAQHTYEALGMNGNHYRLYEWMVS